MRLLILLLLSLNIFAQEIVQFKFSKSHGVFEFFKANTGIANSNTMLKDLYDKSSEKNKKNDELIEQSKVILDYLRVNYNFNSKVETRRSGQSLEKQFTIQSILADNLEEFKSRTTGLIPVQVHKDFFDKLKEVEVIYEKVIWNNSIAKIEIYKRNIQQMANKIQIDDMFKNAIKFYRGNWPNKTPFTIGLHPIPAIKGSTKAESLGAVESVSVLLDAKDFQDRIGVIFHEICHSIYSSQSEEFKLEIEKNFKKSESEYAPYAYHFFNEILATALGNGLAYSKAAGRVDRSQWYNNDYIDKMAKAIYEKTKVYVNSQKPIDYYFIDFTIKQFEQLFPKANKDYENLLNEFLLITENKQEAKDYINTVRKSFKSNSIYHYDPINSSTSINGLKSFLPGTVVIVVKDGQETSFQQMSLEFPQLRRLVPLMMKSKKSYILPTYDPKSGSTVIIKTNDKEDFQKAILKLKEMRFVPEKTKQILL